MVWLGIIKKAKNDISKYNKNTVYIWVNNLTTISLKKGNI